MIPYHLQQTNYPSRLITFFFNVTCLPQIVYIENCTNALRIFKIQRNHLFNAGSLTRSQRRLGFLHALIESNVGELSRSFLKI